MKVLVTGHKGYIGTHLFPMIDGAIGCDLKDGNDFADIHGEEFDIVIHLAAVASVMQSMRDPEECLNNNVFKLMPFLRNNHIGRFIFASTGGALYGNKHHAKEQDACWKGCISPYGQSKYLAECVIQALHSNAIMLRLGNVVGGNDGSRTDFLAHHHFRTDIPIVVYGGSQIRDFVSIDMVCEAFLRVVKSNLTGAFNIASGVETRVADVATQHAKERSIPLVYAPARIGEIDCISLDCTKAQKAGLL
jgi:UDP-glucose 4-epimerase